MVDRPSSTLATDIPSDDWIERRLPSGLKPYCRLARIDRPVGTWLLLLPCWWGVALASTGWPDPWFLLLFAVGALLMRGAGCVVNDIADRDFDARVARTAARPLPSGQVTVRQALFFTAALSLAGLLVLIQFNRLTIAIGIASLVLVALYPFMKRITYWPQAFLGLVFNWGALLGWTAVRGSLDAPALLLYAAGILWTLGYDTIYAHQDKADDLIVGVKSTALRFGGQTKPWLWAFYGGGLAMLGVAGVAAGLSWPFFAILALGAGHLAVQIVRVDLDTVKSCLATFRSNRDFGLIIFAAIVAGRLAG